MLWHRQAIFESKGDTNADWMPTHKPTELSRIKQNFNSTARPYDEYLAKCPGVTPLASRQPFAYSEFRIHWDVLFKEAITIRHTLSHNYMTSISIIHWYGKCCGLVQAIVLIINVPSSHCKTHRTPEQKMGSPGTRWHQCNSFDKTDTARLSKWSDPE